MELKQIKIGNLYGERSFLFSRAAIALGIPSAIESPAIVFDDQASIFFFNEAQELLDLGAVDIILDQCRFGGASTKPTYFRGRFPANSISALGVWRTLELRCNHEGGHPKLLGKAKAPPWMRFNTSASQVYPAELNAAMAKAIIAFASNRPVKPVRIEAPARNLKAYVSPIQVDLAVGVQGRSSLIQRSKKHVEDDGAVGGLRSPAAALLTKPQALVKVS